MKKEIKAQSLALRMPGRRLTWDFLEPAFKFGILIAGFLIILLSIKYGFLFQGRIGETNGFDSLFIRILFVLSMVIFLFSLAFRTLLWFKYRPYDSRKVEAWPEVTVIVPAYNEGETVFRTIHSIARSDYPKDKMHIIAVNDGSRDNTYFHMERARADFPHLVDIIDQPVNKGKRQGIYDAYRKAHTPYIITIDSDTKLETSSIKELLTPMILNETIGAVTGRIKVWNKETNMLTRMLHAHFAMAFDFTRAIQSTFSCVFCLAGAFSAYRVSVLRIFIDRWLNQKFLNITCTYGEDRSLTNHILREGFGSYFQRSAVSHTIVPEKFVKIMKMLTRWARSNIRETIIFSKLMFNSKRKGNKILPFIEFFSTVSLLLLHFIWFYYFLFSGMVDANFLFRILSYSVFFGFLYIIYYMRIEGKKDSPYILFFSVFASIFMIWIFTVAGFTLTRKGWSTR
jgi:hyaluronan synthase